ncbi:MAG: hypothetical protein F4210_17500 [Holophagales bacterium]|nr:hypothetical protein [Holophagales bacterium]
MRRSFPLLLLSLAWLSGCVSTGPDREPAFRAGGPAREAAPWEIPEAEWRTQRIVRMRYEGPEGSGTLRLVLRFEDPDSFHVSASDRLGRRWWDLNVLEGNAMVLWVRERTFCRYAGDLEIPALSLGPVPASAVAALLMRRLPAPPADTGVWEETAVSGRPDRGVELDFEDRRGRRWTTETSVAGPNRWAPNRWTLWSGDRARATWRADVEGMARLVESDTGLELRWTQPKPATELAAPLPAPAVPSGYRPGVCGADA